MIEEMCTGKPHHRKRVIGLDSDEGLLRLVCCIGNIPHPLLPVERFDPMKTVNEREGSVSHPPKDIQLWMAWNIGSDYEYSPAGPSTRYLTEN